MNFTLAESGEILLRDLSRALIGSATDDTDRIAVKVTHWQRLAV